LIKVIVTQRIDYIDSYDETRDAIDQKLSEWLTQAGCLPIPISNKLIIVHNDKDTLVNEQPMFKNWLSAINPNALLLSGGNDIGEYPARDNTEKYLLDWAKVNKIPVLGICRGMQIMAKWSGANLKSIKGHVNIKHPLIIEVNEKLPKIVNSYHDYAITNCPKDFKTIATSEDSCIEAIAHLYLPWEGWMWHPERENPFIKEDLDRIKQLFKIKN